MHLVSITSRINLWTQILHFSTVHCGICFTNFLLSLSNFFVKPMQNWIYGIGRDSAKITWNWRIISKNPSSWQVIFFFVKLNEVYSMLSVDGIDIWQNMPHFHAFSPLSKSYIHICCFDEFFRENTFLFQLGLMRCFDEIFGKCL